MADKLDEACTAARRLSPEWDEQRAARSLARLEGSIRRRRAVAIGLGGALAAALVLVPSLYLRGLHQPASAVPPAALVLGDGSSATPLSTDTDLVAAEVTPERATLELRSGAARFSVVHGRQFQVVAGDVHVHVLGTKFEVRRAGDKVAVDVERGRVKVDWVGGETELGAGEHGMYPPAPGEIPATAPAPAPAIATAAPAPAPEPAPAPAVPSKRTRHAPIEPAATPEPMRTAPRAAPAPAPAPAPDWKDLARQGDFDKAYGSMHTNQDDVRKIDGVEELLLAADVARYSGHPNDAVPLLLEALEHADDHRQPLAAFTLGRLLLDQLGQPARAATLFARARAADPSGDLAEDALAREVEALSRAGQADEAHARALEYRRIYPEGRRAKAVARFGKLD